MYRYDQLDRQLVAERTEQFRGQVRRRLANQLSEEEFKPLRLMNGLYWCATIGLSAAASSRLRRRPRRREI